MTIRSLLVTAAAALLLHGCSSTRETADADGTLGADEVIAAVNAGAAAMPLFTASGSIDVASPQFSQSVGFTAAVKRPDSVLVSVDGPFGIPLLRGLLTPGSFTAYNALNNTLYTGDPSRANGGLPFLAGLRPETLVDAMTGQRRFGPEWSSPDSFRTAEGMYRLSFSDTSHRSDVAVEARSMRIAAVTMRRADGSVLWKERYEYERGADSLWRPAAVRLQVPARKMTVEFRFDEVTPQPALQGLTLEVPDDAERVRMP